MSEVASALTPSSETCWLPLPLITACHIKPSKVTGKSLMLLSMTLGKLDSFKLVEVTQLLPSQKSQLVPLSEDKRYVTEPPLRLAVWLN